MNDRMKGFYRDKSIVETVMRYKCLNTDQIQRLIFPGMKSGRRKCQMRLKKLVDRGKLKRWRYDLEEPYAYYVDRTEQMDHIILLNWFLIWQRMAPKTWGDELCSFSYEQDYGILRADAFVTYRNRLSNAYTFAFVEMDRAESGNRFDKVKKYNDLYVSDNYMESWWKPLARGFPAINIVTTDTRRLKRIQEAVRRDNKHGLEFNVYLIDKIRKEVLNGEIIRLKEA